MGRLWIAGHLFVASDSPLKAQARLVKGGFDATRVVNKERSYFKTVSSLSDRVKPGNELMQ